MSNFGANTGYLNSGTQTQATSTFEPGNSKLRATCDRCSTLKVRCNKQKPACDRCETLGLHCVYSPFRWKGRPSSNNNSSSNNNNNSSANTSNAASTAKEKSRTGSNASLNTTVTTPGPEVDMSPIVPLTLATTTDDAAAAAFLDGDKFPLDDDFTVSTLGLGSTMPWVLSVPTPTLSNSDDMVLQSAADDTPYHSTPSRSSPILRDQGLPDAFGRETCLDMALDALCRLHRVPSETSRCLRDSPSNMSSDVHMLDEDGLFGTATNGISGNNTNGKNGTVTPNNNGCGIMSTDQAMKVNRAALQTMHHIASRNCGSCTADPNLVLMLYNISTRMVTRYRAIFDCIRHYPPQQQPQNPFLPHAHSHAHHQHHQSHHQHQHHYPGLPSPAPTLPGTARQSAEILYFNPVQFVDFKMDLATSRRMNSQLLLHEIKSLGRFLEGTWGVGMEGGSPSGSISGSNPSGCVGDELDSCLNLSALVKNADESMDGHNGGSGSGQVGGWSGVQEAFRGFLTGQVAELAVEINGFCQALD
uniref:MollA n=2 Tax=Ovatospora TaxID=1934392 RepID=A0AA96XQY5_9PEZI|nr:Zinc finger transcription factor [Ovatospora brasiliensis]WNZ75136.1 MollA [Ovatospora sp.]